jgi:hypothetical protein
VPSIPVAGRAEFREWDALEQNRNRSRLNLVELRRYLDSRAGAVECDRFAEPSTEVFLTFIADQKRRPRRGLRGGQPWPTGWARVEGVATRSAAQPALPRFTAWAVADTP